MVRDALFSATDMAHVSTRGSCVEIVRPLPFAGPGRDLRFAFLPSPDLFSPPIVRGSPHGTDKVLTSDFGLVRAQRHKGRQLPCRISAMDDAIDILASACLEALGGEEDLGTRRRKATKR